MGTRISFADQELARKLERVFQMFSRAQKEWAMAHIPEPSTGDMDEDAKVSA